MENFNYVDLEKYRDQIEAIKIMVVGLPATCTISPREVLGKSIQYIYKFSETDETDYRDQILILIQAYLEMGFSYEDEQEFFDHILGSLNLNKKLQFRQEYMNARRIKANRTQVQRLIGNWPESDKEKYTADQIVDIILR